MNPFVRTLLFLLLGGIFYFGSCLVEGGIAGVRYVQENPGKKVSREAVMDFLIPKTPINGVVSTIVAALLAFGFRVSTFLLSTVLAVGVYFYLQFSVTYVQARLRAQTTALAPAPGSIAASATAIEAQQHAVQRYPQLGIAGSRLNVEFVRRHALYQKTMPAYFIDPEWPTKLAAEADAATR